MTLEDSLRRAAEIKGTTEELLDRNVEIRKGVEHENVILEQENVALRADTTDLALAARKEAENSEDCDDLLKAQKRRSKWNNILRSALEAVGVAVIVILAIK